MARIFNAETLKFLSKKVKVCGWAQSIRVHGKVIFVDLRDKSGILQIVFTPNKAELYKKAETLRPEWVISVEGIIRTRPKGMVNPKIKTGEVEMEAEELEIFCRAKTLPFAVDNDGYEIDEEKRLKYRYLDLRRERMRKNMEFRQQVIWFIRNYLMNKGFVEIETPILTKSTPEGARDYVVPSRLQPGKFYALPQSPQQYKQLLMVASLERYFQIARCFRDEDPRADRQPEFTQLDLEMSFVKREDVMDLVEPMFIELVQKLKPEKKIQEIPFPRLGYKEAMEKYGTDRPDIRKDKNDPELLAFCWVIDFPFFEKDKEGGWTFTHNPFSAPKDEHLQWLMKKEHIPEILTTQYDIVLNGLEIGGGSIRNHQPEALEKVFEIMGFETERIRQNFGHMLEAFSYGAPPHGGIAPGIDRIVALLQNEPNIREVIAFPKTGDGRDPMMSSPSEITEEQLRELHIKIRESKK